MTSGACEGEALTPDAGADGSPDTEEDAAQGEDAAPDVAEEMPDVPGCAPGIEVCDGADNDCDGAIDEASALSVCPLLPGAAATSCQGGRCADYACAAGYVDLDDDLTRAGSNGCDCALTEPSTEVCDGVDNDCDGLVDAEDDDFEPPLCPVQAGVCAGAVQRCEGEALLACVDEDYAAVDARFTALEPDADLTCDVVDENCDGDAGGLGNPVCCEPGLEQKRLGEVSINRSQRWPSLVATADGGAQIIWQEGLNIGNEEQLFFADVDRSGVAEASPQLLNMAQLPLEQQARLVEGDAGLAMTWLQGTPFEPRQLQVLYPLENTLRDVLEFGPRNISESLLVPWSNDEVLAVWAQQASCVNGGAGGSCLRVRRIGVSGLNGTEWEVSGSLGANAPSVARLEDGALIAWRGQEEDSSRSIRVQRVNVSGESLPDSSNRLSIPFVGGAPVIYEATPELLAVEGRVFLVMEDIFNGITQLQVRELFLRPTLSAGPVLWVSTGGASKSAPKLVSIGEGGGLELAVIYVEGGVQVMYQRLPLGEGALVPAARPLGEAAVAPLPYRPLAVAPVPGVGNLVVVSRQLSSESVDRLELMTLNADGDRIFCP